MLFTLFRATQIPLTWCVTQTATAAAAEEEEEEEEEEATPPWVMMSGCRGVFISACRYKRKSDWGRGKKKPLATVWWIFFLSARVCEEKIIYRNSPTATQTYHWTTKSWQCLLPFLTKEEFFLTSSGLHTLLLSPYLCYAGIGKNRRRTNIRSVRKKNVNTYFFHFYPFVFTCGRDKSEGGAGEYNKKETFFLKFSCLNEVLSAPETNANFFPPRARHESSKAG